MLIRVQTGRVSAFFAPEKQFQYGARIPRIPTIQFKVKVLNSREGGVSDWQGFCPLLYLGVSSRIQGAVYEVEDHIDRGDHLHGVFHRGGLAGSRTRKEVRAIAPAGTFGECVSARSQRRRAGARRFPCSPD